MKKTLLTLELCNKLSKESEKIQKEIGVDMSVAISDKYGNLIYYYRFGDAILPSIEISQKKAYTAAVVRQSTREFGEIARVDGDAFGINITNSKLVIFGGGYPLIVKGEVIGGLGVSGGSVDEDEKVAKYILEVFKEEMKK
ncbi:GlcG/HbpS family heme-binding protein [Miniphocaeibacter halophilus]|uniref:Heme-binding protein n=1 Tax=Miniphocaeibacter halophilus TaxID=2931922 RepID=A0AC61MSI0_9FIRM|nr:heme-binding protein [Miniphocaeibacter halophilus]QQK07414.1 heme-binding protein [Miniphocaeibacter halophilus]